MPPVDHSGPDAVLEDERDELSVDLVAGEGGVLDLGDEFSVMVDAVHRFEEEEVDREFFCDPCGDGVRGDLP